MFSQSFFKTLPLFLLSALISTALGHDDDVDVIISSGDTDTDTDTRELSARIAGGQEATIYLHPYTVSIRRKNCVDCPYEHCCGGSIYADDVIITSKACVLDLKPKHLHVIAGSSQLENAIQDGGMIFPVKEISIHPNAKVDLALLKLAVKIPIGEKLSIRPIELAKTAPNPGTLAIIVGWGKTTEDGKYSEHLREANVPIVNQTECALKNTEPDNIYNAEYDICAGSADGSMDACDGDAGGPLLVNGNLVGVTSRGYGCTSPGKFGIYTNVIQLREWIALTAKGVRIAFL